jgi:hypothetical protein
VAPNNAASAILALLHWPKASVSGQLRLLALVDHLLEQRRLVELEPDPDRHSEENGRQQEGDAPAPSAECFFAHAGADTKDQKQREEQAEGGRGLNPRRVEPTLVAGSVLGDVGGGAAIFAAQRQALHEAERD